MNLITELHSGGLSGHYGMVNTKTLMREEYFFLSIIKEVRKFVDCCRVFQLSKGQSQNNGLYSLLLVSEGPWEDVSMDLTLEIHWTKRKHDYVMVVVDKF